MDSSGSEPTRPPREMSTHRTPPATRGAADRVRRSHAQTRWSLRCALAFLAAAAVVGALAALRGWTDARWLVLHLFFAGGLVSAISGVSVMLAVTWSAAPAPPESLSWFQRLCVVVGAAGVAVARHVDAPEFVVAVAGTIYLVGLLTLAALLGTTLRQRVGRRFDIAISAYLAAVAAGVVGVVIGVTMASAGPTPALRDAHLSANALGLVGLVIGGTLPFFAATVGRSKMARVATAARLGTILGWQVVMLALVTVSVAFDASIPAAVGLAGYAAGVVATMAMMPRPTRRMIGWSGPRLLALWLGSAWWALAVAVGGIEVAAGERLLGGRWLWVLVVAGYAQILWGSLAYLLPMLRGGGHVRLREGFAATRSWAGLLAVNVAGVCLVVGWTGAALAAGGLWALDAAWRALRVGTRRAPRPASG